MEGRDILQRIAWLAIAAPRRVIAVAALVMVAAGIFGIPVVKSLSAGGFQDPTSESSKATHLLTDKFDQGDLQLLITVCAPDGFVSGPAQRGRHRHRSQLRQSPHVLSVASAWTVPPEAALSCQRVGKCGLIVAGITGGYINAQIYVISV